MKRKLLLTLLALTMVFACTFALAACGDIDDNPDTTPPDTEQGDNTPTPSKPASERLEFTWLKYYSGYAVSGIGKCKDAEIIIPSTYKDKPVVAIGNAAFYGCHNLTSITIPDSVIAIGSSAFCACSGLTSITIPDRVTSIGYNAFIGCSGLTSVTVESGNTKYHSAGNCIIETANKTLIVGCMTSIIPNNGSVTSIGKEAFYGCSSLTSITIPDSVTSIDMWAFGNCPIKTATIPAIAAEAIINSALQTVVITSGETIGKEAFYGCSSLTSITIPDSVTKIGERAFEFCRSLTSVIIPNSVTSIGRWAFGDCSGLTSVTIGNSVTKIGENAFGDCSNLTSIKFEGTRQQWNDIQKDTYWDYFTAYYTVQCIDGKLDKNGNEVE